MTRKNAAIATKMVWKTDRNQNLHIIQKCRFLQQLWPIYPTLTPQRLAWYMRIMLLLKKFGDYSRTMQQPTDPSRKTVKHKISPRASR